MKKHMLWTRQTWHEDGTERFYGDGDGPGRRPRRDNGPWFTLAAVKCLAGDIGLFCFDLDFGYVDSDFSDLTYWFVHCG